MSNPAPLIPMNQAYTPFQQLLIDCVDWAEKCKPLAVTHSSNGCSEAWRNIGKKLTAEKADKVIEEIQKQVLEIRKVLRDCKISNPHPGLFQEVSWLLGYKPYYIKASLLDPKHPHGLDPKHPLLEHNAVVINLVFEYSKPTEPTVEEVTDDKINMEKYFPTNQWARDFRIGFILENLTNQNYSKRRTAEISVQTDN